MDSKWGNFTKVIEKAKESCRNAGFNVLDHFPDVRKKVKLGSPYIKISEKKK
jgi:DNA-damage-inducible protein D